MTMRHLFLFIYLVYNCKALRTLQERDLADEDASEVRIVGGSPAKQSNWPFLVFVGTRRSNSNALFHRCGGSLLHPSYVLTAGHCVYRNEDDLAVLAGHIRLPVFEEKGWEDVVSVAAYSLHPDFIYNASTMPQNDLALLKLAKPLVIDNITIATIEVNDDNETCPYTAAKHTCKLAGWGRLSNDGPVSIRAMELAVTAITNDKCREDLYNELSNDQLCAGEIGVGGKDACSGDSGGPLVCRCKERDLLTGVVSFGEKGCSLPDFPTVYSRVSYNSGWIRDVLASPDQCEWVANEQRRAGRLRWTVSMGGSGMYWPRLTSMSG